MKNRGLVLFFVGHFALSLVGFLALSGWSLATVDAETVAGRAVDQEAAAGEPMLPVTSGRLSQSIARFVHFGLLQPLAHWVLASGAVAWWTWLGILELAAVIALNSGVVAGLVRICLLARAEVRDQAAKAQDSGPKQQ